MVGKEKEDGYEFVTCLAGILAASGICHAKKEKEKEKKIKREWLLAWISSLGYHHLDIITWISSLGYHHLDIITWISSLGYHPSLIKWQPQFRPTYHLPTDSLPTGLLTAYSVQHQTRPDQTSANKKNIYKKYKK